MMSLSGKIAVITGSSEGIGYAVARALLTRGASIVVTGTKQDKLTQAAVNLRKLASSREQVLAVQGDVRRYQDVERLIETTVTHFGSLDILINNAGIGVWGSVSEISLDDWHAVLDTNLTGVFYCCRVALPHLQKNNSGWIINISSLASKNPFPGGSAYCASKSALNAFSEVLMQEVRHDGIRVAHVLPGSVKTNFRGQAGKNIDWKLSPEDVAEVVTDLLMHPARSLPSRVELRPSRPPRGN
jgi:3-oxoacyl-[acyl-carrier protein] reductase